MYVYNLTMRIFARDGSTLAHPINATSTPYSGTHAGRNNPAMCNVSNIGPLPPGRYRIERSRDSATLGPVIFDLTPLPGTDTFGRSLFRIHGNDKLNDASHGCLILDRNVRDLIASVVDFAQPANDNADYNVLEVIAA